MNFARLNHIIIPERAEKRMALRHAKGGFIVRGALRIYSAYTPKGLFVLLLWLVITTLSYSKHNTMYYVVWSLVSGALVASLIIRPWVRSRGVSLRVSHPQRVRVGEEMHFHIALHNSGPEPVHALELEPPFLPWDGVLTQSPTHVDVLPVDAHRTVVARLRFRARGQHSIMPFVAEPLAPLGLTRGRQVASAISPLTAGPGSPEASGPDMPLYPRHQPGGIALASRAGEALELMGVRPYQPGDRIRDLHPPTWGRTGVPHVRHYQQEYYLRTAVLLDVFTRRGRVSERRFEASVSLAAGCVAALLQGDALGDLLLCCEQMPPVTIGRRTGTLDTALDTLACVQGSPEVSMDAVQDYLAPLLPRLSSLVLVALEDDDATRELQQWIAAQGVMCRTLSVGQGGQTSGAPVQWVPLQAVERFAQVRL